MPRHHNRAVPKRMALPDLSKTFAMLSPRRQELFRPILENPRAYVLLSARHLAHRLKVDPATAVRVTMKLGFGSYRDFQHYLHDLSLSHSTPPDLIHTTQPSAPSLSPPL